MRKLRNFFKKLRMIFVWTIVSLLLQGGAYYALNSKVEKVLSPVDKEPEIVTRDLTATIPGTDLKNIQLSYDKSYLAYLENGALKVYNLVEHTQVYEKEPPASTDSAVGIHAYQWLPDRNTLLYYYTKKNPNEVTKETIYPPAQVITIPKDPEDPNSVDTTQTIPSEPQVKTIYGNPHITELYTLELPESNDTETLPDDRFNKTIDQLPKNGKIVDQVFSTMSNLIYLKVTSDSSQLLLEIDVMKDVTTLNKSGETVDRMAASERYGTLYINSTIGNTSQVIALSGSKRWVISKKSTDKILGVQNGKVYIGEVLNGQLEKIKTTSDTSDLADNPTLKTEWEGIIPFKDNNVLIGSNGEVIIYNNQIAYIVTNGQKEEIPFEGDENYISLDGAEHMRLTKQDDSTLVELKPL